MPYRFAWVALVFVGAIGNLGIIWLIADILNALMAIPNLIALLLLSGTVFTATRAYFDREKGGAAPAGERAGAE